MSFVEIYRVLKMMYIYSMYVILNNFLTSIVHIFWVLAHQLKYLDVFPNGFNEPRNSLKGGRFVHSRWSRLACFDNDLVVNSNCSTEGDTSMNALQKVDEVSRYQRCFFLEDFVWFSGSTFEKLGKSLK